MIAGSVKSSVALTILDGFSERAGSVMRLDMVKLNRFRGWCTRACTAEHIRFSYDSILKTYQVFFNNWRRDLTLRGKCEGWDSNPRTPTRLGPQPSAFDLAWLPSPDKNYAQQFSPETPGVLPLCHNKEVVYLKEPYGRFRPVPVRNVRGAGGIFVFAAAGGGRSIPVFRCMPVRVGTYWCVPVQVGIFAFAYADGSTDAYMYIFWRYTRSIHVG